MVDKRKFKTSSKRWSEKFQVLAPVEDEVPHYLPMMKTNLP